MKEVKSFQTPSDWLVGLKEHWRSDMVSGFLVFLIALPLCLGISKASGFPPIAGIYTAIIGGLLVSFLSGSFLTIKGPAAGLIVIALGAVEELGGGDAFLGYKLTLAVIVVSGLIQIIFGILKSGALSIFFPDAAVHGMLASIGIIIAAKQIHVMLGVAPHAKESIELMMEIPNSIKHFDPKSTFIGLVSIIILFTIPNLKSKVFKLIPAPLIVLLVSAPLALIFNLDDNHHYVFGGKIYEIFSAKALVDLPDSFWSGIVHPDFSRISSLVSIKYIIMFSIVGSIESLLSCKAIDILDPFKRKSNYNKELIGVGVGNTIAGFVGGLPMISEIVRSSSNINNGARTRWSNFMHALFLLIFVLFFTPLVEMIPNAALAAMLIFTGYRLASPKEFVQMYKIGPEQFIIFVTTLIVTLSTDLLIGIIAGILMKILLHSIFGLNIKDALRKDLKFENDESENIIIKIGENATFLNFIQLQKQLREVKMSAMVKLDFKDTLLIDHTYMSNLQLLMGDFENQGGRLELINTDHLTPYSNHPTAARKKINNSVFSEVKIRLNPRQVSLKEYAEKHNLSYESARKTTIIKYNLTPFSLTKRAVFGENIILGENERFKFFFADVFISEGAMMTKSEYSITVLYLSNLQNITIPDFNLEPQRFTDFIKSVGGYQDINFHEHPEFSRKYYLTGDDVDKIKSTFTEQVLEFLAQKRPFYAESRNNNLLFYIDYRLTDASEYDNMLADATDFLDTLGQKISKY
ncbi:MAG: SulP family inorganic anion transporter [Cytophagales bacterium]